MRVPRPAARTTARERSGVGPCSPGGRTAPGVMEASRASGGLTVGSPSAGCQTRRVARCSAAYGRGRRWPRSRRRCRAAGGRPANVVRAGGGSGKKRRVDLVEGREVVDVAQEAGRLDDVAVAEAGGLEDGAQVAQRALRLLDDAALDELRRSPGRWAPGRSRRARPSDGDGLAVGPTAVAARRSSRWRSFMVSLPLRRRGGDDAWRPRASGRPRSVEPGAASRGGLRRRIEGERASSPEPVSRHGRPSACLERRRAAAARRAGARGRGATGRWRRGGARPRAPAAGPPTPARSSPAPARRCGHAVRPRRSPPEASPRTPLERREDRRRGEARREASRAGRRRAARGAAAASSASPMPRPRAACLAARRRRARRRRAARSQVAQRGVVGGQAPGLGGEAPAPRPRRCCRRRGRRPSGCACRAGSAAPAAAIAGAPRRRRGRGAQDEVVPASAPTGRRSR